MALRAVEPLPASTMIAHEHFFSHISLLMPWRENAKQSVRRKKISFSSEKACQPQAGSYNAPRILIAQRFYYESNICSEAPFVRSGRRGGFDPAFVVLRR